MIMLSNNDLIQSFVHWRSFIFIIYHHMSLQASSVGSSLSVQPSFFNSSLLSHQQQQQQLQQLQQQQQPNAMIWASPGLKHLGSQSRLSVPLGLPSSAGDYQMQTGGAPGVYQLPPVADTGQCYFRCFKSMNLLLIESLWYRKTVLSIRKFTHLRTIAPVL